MSFRPLRRDSLKMPLNFFLGLNSNRFLGLNSNRAVHFFPVLQNEPGDATASVRSPSPAEVPSRTAINFGYPLDRTHSRTLTAFAEDTRLHVREFVRSPPRFDASLSQTALRKDRRGI